MRVADCMHHNPPTVRRDTPVAEATTLMRTSKIFILPVGDDRNQLLGMIDADTLRAAAEGETSEERMLSSTLAIHPDAPSDVAGAILRLEGRRALPVARRGMILGVVSRETIARAPMMPTHRGPRVRLGSELC